MSDDGDNYVAVKLGLPWIAVAIGGLSAWLVLETTESIILGALMGIVVSLASYLGFIPIGGILIYHLVVNMLFTWMNLSLPLLYLYGLIWAIIYTIISTIILIILLCS